MTDISYTERWNWARAKQVTGCYGLRPLQVSCIELHPHLLCSLGRVSSPSFSSPGSMHSQQWHPWASHARRRLLKTAALQVCMLVCMSVFLGILHTCVYIVTPSLRAIAWKCLHNVYFKWIWALVCFIAFFSMAPPSPRVRMFCHFLGTGRSQLGSPVKCMEELFFLLI